ncbi:hypothetical protein [Peribacillus sp. SCS-37]|uniref:hypothetical protein n=1 Tax=Paraperibacillus esterisolvens TaxID=3115296 RepID=UPI00390685E9
MKTSTVLKWITGALEAFLGIPFLGGAIILGFSWMPLILMGFLHLITLIISAAERENRHGSVLGIITSCIAWFPVLGMIMHIVTGLVLIIDALRSRRREAL